MKPKYLLLITVTLGLLASCKSEPSGSDVQLPATDAVQIVFFKEGKDSPETNRTLLRKDAKELGKVLAMMGAPEADGFNCGYAGKLELLSKYAIVKSVNFQLDPKCRHLSWLEGDQTRSAALSEQDARWLDSLRTSPFGIDELSFMLGSWYQVEKDSAISTETWGEEGGNLRGLSYTIFKGDTVFSEKLSVVRRGTEVFYVADVKENIAPVEFKLEFMEGKMAGFSNPTHDWPQKISYRMVTPDSLVARVEGTANGQYGAKSFQLRRKKGAI